MKTLCSLCAIALLLIFAGCAEQAEITTPDKTTGGDFTSFVAAEGGELIDENGPLRFISYNIPCLHYNEDYLPFDEMIAWRFPDEFEIRDALEAVRQMGGQVARTYTLSVRKADDDPALPRHVLGPGRFNEEAFVALDKVLQIANEKGIRVIIPFVDNWVWWGGVAEYAGFRGKEREAFWTDAELFEDFKKTIEHVINRKNTLTGVYYRDDKAILGWETGNELQCPHEWTVKTAAYIKSLDKNHLVIDGFHTDTLRAESIHAPETDVVTSHHYSQKANETISQIQHNKARAGNIKPYFVGEFGFLSTPDIERILDTVVETDTSGALIWSLRKRNRNGGFYWHSEPAGGNLYKAYHWPGFESGQQYDEKNLLQLMRTKASEIRGVSVPAMEKPAAPVLLPFSDVSAIRWQGSTGAESYTIERGEYLPGPWETIATGIDDAWAQYRPLYNDASAQSGQVYYYRVKAVNGAGQSAASNIVGPVYVANRTLVDEMVDLRQTYHHEGIVSIESEQARKFKEDIHRLKGSKDASVIYHLPQAICHWKVYAFYEKDVTGLSFSLSTDGRKFHDVTSDSHEYFSGEGSYGYCKPVEYRGQAPSKDSRYLKISFTDVAHLSRVEIGYDYQQMQSTAASPVGFVKGFSWGWTGWRGQYEGAAPRESMQKMAATNANWVCLAFGAEMETFDSPKILWSDNNPKMVSDDEIRGAIQLARDNGLNIILKPVVNVRDGTWRAWIKFDHKDGTKDLEAWDRWWNDFRAMLLHYAKIAEEADCEMLCLGCEMEATEDDEDRWRALIADIRQIYKGPVTYNANHGGEDKLTWWDAVDVISISAYYPVGTDDVGLALEDDLSKVPTADSSVQALKKRWLPIKEKLKIISYKYDLPILFIEQGVCSAKGFSAAPWTHPQSDVIYDGDEQRRLYQATIETFWDESWFMGFIWWDWPPNLYTVEEAKRDTGFCIYGKPAEKLVTEWYGKTR